MAENLVIVESPAKARTIKKYLGKDFEVLASYGHVRDLVPKEGAVDPDARLRDALSADRAQRASRRGDHPARCAAHTRCIWRPTRIARVRRSPGTCTRSCSQRGELDDKRVHRVVFHEITRNAIREAVATPRDLSLDLVNAQQARRALDYLVGFNLSPLLWKKVRRGLSAGRVQSPALRMICEREAGDRGVHAAGILDHRCARDEHGRAARISRSSWSNIAAARSSSSASPDESSARAAEQALAAAAGTSRALRVLHVDRKQRRRNPAPPFTTSTLQQEASRKLGFSAQRTMRLAQQLYEGVDIGEGSVGLISYMRTDSVSLAAEAVQEIREVIARLYGKQSVAEEPRVYKTKSKNAQEAHEAIRPTVRGHRPGGHRAQA